MVIRAAKVIYAASNNYNTSWKNKKDKNERERER